MIRRAMAKTRKVTRPAISYKSSVAPATMMNVNAPVSTRPTRRAATKALERISDIVNTKRAREIARATREEVAAEEAARKARAAERKAATAEKKAMEAERKAIEAEEKRLRRPIGTRGESVANVTEMFSMLTVPSAGINNSGSPVPVYRTRRRLSPLMENY